ncbi:transglycosylase SLT domain-containing protein [Pseudenhygromyxa sp. WMMC2535]|uniref:M56 family metallopeptidase n=1 Tax=Pseudenhygromyxa sp. WMMC2535 TaxID=2712867 RepID=UPI0015544452|nr:M56 family metallopeptidase [Pseudenhygromyxa sp. WMMC2535]NVB36747.1 transglycosylase SLT domain-containing protein [Pseudenhygromyxa sp. WMMC2535]
MNLLATPAAIALAWALLHGLWQAALIALIVRVAMFGARTPRARFAWAWSGLAALSLAFVLTWRVEFEAAQTLLARAALLAAPPLPAPASVGLRARLLAAFELAMPWIVIAWLLGASYRLTRVGLGFAGVRRLRATARQCLDANIEGLARELGERLGLTRTTPIAESDALEVPAVVGWLRPLILLPAGLAARVEPQVLEAAIAHELAHLRRGDYLLNAAIMISEALFFHHPCVWWMADLARREREHACDDLVVASVQPPARYARALLDLELARVANPHTTSAPSPSLGADGAPLRARVQRLLHPDTSATKTMTKPLTKHREHLPSWIPSLALVAGLGLTFAAPACGPGDSDANSPEALVEGTIDLDDTTATLDVPWLPASVTAHRETIEAAAHHHGVDPDLLAIVVLLESGGDPQAQSPTGARGLMQLMPATAAQIAAERELSEYELERLWDPAYNLDLGAYFLSQQLERWGEVELAAASYNGGPQLVERWLAGEAALSEETEHYRAAVAELWQARHAAERPQ